jgi:hypothetical protein
VARYLACQREQGGRCPVYLRKRVQPVRASRRFEIAEKDYKAIDRKPEELRQSKDVPVLTAGYRRWRRVVMVVLHFTPPFSCGGD